VQSIDVLTPVVDDPVDFGRIAAANSVSDLYAMGATPRFALSFAAFPRDVLPMSVLVDINRGAAMTAQEAGMSIIGGHTIHDKEPKFGLAVTGVIHPDKVVTNAGGEAGDFLVLTKAIGTGIVTTANKRVPLDEHELEEVVTLMSTLNAGAARAMVECGIRCATDITGFGLLGHLNELASGSKLSAELYMDDVPVLDSARRLAGQNIFPGGSRRNLEYLRPNIVMAEDISETEALILADAQTSGGLLMSVKAKDLQKLLSALSLEQVATATVVGRLLEGPPGRIHVLRQRND
jgi:selenide,water dikinase